MTRRESVLSNNLVLQHIDMAIQARLDDDKNLYRSHIAYELNQEPACESPLEAVLAAWLCLSVYGNSKGFGLRVERQVEIETAARKYRADFLIGWYGKDHDRLPIVVEVDGHEFHEKTREQVEKRNERDRDLQQAGYPVLHFSFAEVVKRPADVVEEIWCAVRLRFDDEWREQMEAVRPSVPSLPSGQGD